MDMIRKSGITAGVIGAGITLLNLVVLGSWFKVFTEQTAILLLLLLLGNLLAFAVAGLASGVLVAPYARNSGESLKSGLIAGGIVACSPVLFTIVLSVAGVIKLGAPPLSLPMLLGYMAFASILVSQVALAGLISFAYAHYHKWTKQKREATSPQVEDADLRDLDILYKDLRQDARTLVTDMNRSILLYLFAGAFTLVYGFVILAYALGSWNLIHAGNAQLADYVAAIGETIGGVVQIIVGPLLIRWYFTLKARYARLAAIEKREP